MSVPFSQTMRAMRSEDRVYSRVAIFFLLGLVLLWGFWFFFASVTLYEPASTAALVEDPPSHAVTAPFSGRIVAVHTDSAATCKSGTLLFTMDAEHLRSRLETARSTVSLLPERIAALDQEISALEEAESLSGALMRVEGEKAELAEQGAAQLLDTGRELLAMQETLAESGSTSAQDLLESRAEAEARATTWKLSGKDKDAVRLTRELVLTQSRALSAQRRAERLSLQARYQSLQREILELERQIRESDIRAPFASQVVLPEPMRPGSFVTQGTVLALLPSGGKPVIQAHMKAGPAVGRVRLGQQARMAIDGFPPTEFGFLEAKVSRIAPEPVDGLVRIDLQLKPPFPEALAPRVGMSGDLEIAVGRFTPFQLFMRTLGRSLTGNDPVMEQP